MFSLPSPNEGNISYLALPHRVLRANSADGQLLGREEIRHLGAVALADDNVTSTAPFDLEAVILKQRLDTLRKLDDADTRQDDLGCVRFRRIRQASLCRACEALWSFAVAA